MFTKNILKLYLSLLAASLILTACGGGGDGGSDNTPRARETGIIYGNVFDAPVYGATVNVWEYDDGKLGRKLASATTDSVGNYKLEFEASSRPLLVRSEGGGYTDPLTKETVSVSNGNVLKLDAVINYSEGKTHSLMLTPLTNIAAGLAKYKISKGEAGSSAISSAIGSVNTMYGFNVNETLPIDITKGGQSGYATPGHQYGALLTAYSSLSYDMIKKHGNSDNVYTSMHLADIQYRDVVADGLLNGEEISPITGGLTKSTFGQKKITSDVYTNELSQHVLIVVNNPDLNVSGTSGDDYVEFSKQLNGQGTNGNSGGLIPPRDETQIDTTAPSATRVGSEVLAGKDKVAIALTDEVGVKDVSVYIQYELNGSWSSEYQCDDLQSSGSQFCSIVFDEFKAGLRETKINVNIDTAAIDSVDVDSSTGLSNVTGARLVAYTSDVLGNALVAGSDNGHLIPFKWDNNDPVIEITSSTTIKKEDTDYVLKGIVKEPPEELASVTVSFKGGLPTALDCVSANSGKACEFSNNYKTSDFLSTTPFEVRATDQRGNVGIEPFEVRQDDQEPTQDLSFPEGAPMNFVHVDVSGERTTIEGPYNQDTYTQDNVQTSQDYLKIDYIYASEGIKKAIPNTDFKNFNPSVLKENKIPYLRVRVFDINSSTVLGSSADDLTLTVKYYVSAKNDGNYTYKDQIKNKAADGTANIPHETIVKENGRVEEMIYYVPFVREILGSSFKSASENSSHMITIQTQDGAGNDSQPLNIYFRSSFDLPTMKVVTPFIGARVQLEGLAPSGEFTSLASCTTQTSQTKTELDVASCEATTDLVNYDFMRVRLIGVEGAAPHYYQWKNDPGAKQEVKLNNANIGAYFKLNGSQTFYLTELSTYQTGLFDYQWNKLAAGGKTSARAIEILDDVKEALAGRYNNSFFGFDPTVTPYATNEMLANAIPKNPSNDYLHRFLVEGFEKLAQQTPLYNSVDFSSAVYDDFSYDGKANGMGAGNRQIVLDLYKFGPDTYRKHLAQHYYDIMTSNGIESNVAQAYADVISKANPNLDGTPIFDKEGESIDKLPPQPTIVIQSGRETTVGSKRYVAGQLESKIILEDPSGIDTKDGSQPKFVTRWYKQGDPNTPIDLDLEITEGGASTSYRKEYGFTLNTQSTNLPGIVEFALETSAKDLQGNAYGYDGKVPHLQSLYVDNDYPKASYVLPNGIESDEVYLNASYVQELTFKVEDTVGDKLDQRGLTFSKLSGEKVSFTHDLFSSNTNEFFKAKLCTGTRCAEQGKIIYPGEGEWLVSVSAEDHLGNKVTDGTSSAPKFKVLIDSKAPVVNGKVISNRLGGNAAWTPDISWGLSPGKQVDVLLKTGAGKLVNLKHYEVEPPTSDEPYLFGTQPDVRVRLIPTAFDYKETNTFKVVAANSAFPASTSEGEFEFKVDNKGPDIVLDSPWISDAVSKESYVMGRKFNIRFSSVTDDSEVKTVSLWQDGKDTALYTLEPKNPSQPFEMSIGTDQSDQIQLDPDDKSVKLIVKATDEYGFVSESQPSKILLDREGPTLSLHGYKPEREDIYYLGKYVFDVIAEDLDKEGVPSLAGVNKESLEYWTYTDIPPQTETGTKIGETLKLPLGDLKDGDNWVRLKGNDVRGNTSTSDFKVKVHNSMPSIKSYALAYKDDQTNIDGAITRDVPVVVTMEVEDVSGIDKIEATYKHSAQPQSSDLAFIEISKGKYQAELSPADLPEDGRYDLRIKVFNNVKYNAESDRKVNDFTKTMSVQRQGVDLTIATPHPFQSHISGPELSVTFNSVGEVKAKTLECWVRENYTSDNAPSDSYAYSGVIDNPQEPYSCTVRSDRSMSTDPVVLITRTIGTNDKSTVKKFRFNMVDTDAPVVKHGDTYQFVGTEVSDDSPDGTNKMLQFSLDFEDKLSGVNTSNKDAYPKLVRNRGNMAFTPQTCTTQTEGKTSCTYIEKYSDVIDGLSSSHDYKIKNLTDIAGNVAADHSLTLLLPTVNPTVEILSPQTDSVIDGQQELRVSFKIKRNDNSRLDNITANVGGTSYNKRDNDDMFSDLKVCGTGDLAGYDCSTFSTQLSKDTDGKTLKVSISAIDVWSNKSSDSINVKVDQSPPTIGEEVFITQSGSDKIRFRFNIKDEVSGLAKVKYEVLNPSFEEEKLTDMDYFELDKSQLEGIDSIQVRIYATDKVNLTTSASKTVDIKTPEVTVSFEGITSLDGGKLLLKNNSQSFTITTVDKEGIRASQYSLELVPSTGDSLKYTGNINSSSANGTMNFTVNDQAAYTFKVAVTDSIGRQVKSFKLFNGNYDDTGIPTIVDHELPTVSIASATQLSQVPDNGRYQLDVTAHVTDKNLNVVSSFADNGSGRFNPQSVTKPTNESDPYVFHYLLAPGSYTFNVSATDLANQSAERTIGAKVEAATIPTLAISTSATPPLAGGEEATLTFKFSEEVKDFDFSDVKLTASDSGGIGQLKQETWATADNITWTVKYLSPVGENKNITIRVDDNSYQSLNTIPGKGDSLLLGVEGVLPTLTNASFTPGYQAIGQSVDVRLEFDKELQSATATLGGTTISSLAATADKKVWTGNVMVPNSVDRSVGLVVSNYTDTLGNVGDDNTSHALPITPTIAIGSINGGNTVNASDAAAVAIIGSSTRFASGESLTVQASDTNGGKTPETTVNVSADGSWNVNLDMSALQDGQITVTVKGENNLNAVATPATGTVQMTRAKPSLTAATFTPGYQAIGQSVDVRLEFDKELQSATATLGGTTISSLAATADKKVWTGNVTVPSSSDRSVGLVVSNYTDTLGNVGDDNTSHALPITPTISIGSINGGNTVNASDAAAVTIIGSSTRFASGESLTVQASDTNGGKTPETTVNVSGDGSWNVNLDMSALQDGQITVTVKGENNLNAVATPATGTVQMTRAKPSLTAASFTPGYQAIGQTVDVRLEFDKELQSATATLGGTTISSLAATADKKVWTGNVMVPSSSDRSVGLVVSNYTDTLGNVGDDNSTYALPITPTIAIGSINGGNTVNASDAAAVAIIGSSTRFASGESLMVQASDTNGGKIPETTVNVSGDGSWSVNLDMSALQDGQITVTVTGENNLNAVATPATGTVQMTRAKPSLTAATFTPGYQAIGQSVDVRLEFDKELQSATATLGGTTISSLAATADKKVWTGNVTVPSSVDRSVGLVVSNYTDTLGNVGDDNSTYALPITPTIAIGSINGGNTVNASDAAAVAIIGSSTRFASGESLTVQASDTNGGKTPETTVNVSGDGSWSVNLDMSALQDGQITVTVTGENNLNAVATPATGSVQMTRAKPSLTAASFTPGYQAIGQSVDVRLEFDKELQSATATLGGTTISSLAATADKKVWTGNVTVPSSGDRSVGLVVSNYTDTLGNVGDDNTSHALPITPTTEIGSINGGNTVNASDAAAVAIIGSSTRFASGESLTVQASDTNGGKTPETTVNVSGDGSWNVNLDMSALQDGQITVTVIGENNLNAVATPATGTVQMTRAKPSLTAASFTPGYQAIGQSVDVRLEFDKELQSAT
ncbi:tandem large repeat, partial [Vibrio tubiashii]